MEWTMNPTSSLWASSMNTGLIAGVGSAVHIEVAQAVLFGGVALANVLCCRLDCLVLEAGSALGIGKIGDHLECFLIYFDSHKNSPFIFF